MTEQKSNRYGGRGVSTSKSEVHQAVEKFDKGLFPKAFCKVIEDVSEDRPDMCTVIHADGSGSKSILAYLHYRETGDATVFEGIAQDSIVMNMDDLLCVGVTDRILLSSTINRNAKTCGAEVIGAIIRGHENFIERLNAMGFHIRNGGGETADLGDLVRTVTVDTCAVARLPRASILGAGIDSGLSIVGLSSTGKASYEECENSGIASNGLTSARHDMLGKWYLEKYPEVCAPETDRSLAYCGPYRLQDALPGSTMNVGTALLSPTRTYLPLIHKLLQEMRPLVRGLIHCTGGAQTKCLRFGNGVHFIKDALFPVPPIFAAIQRASGTSPREMHRVFNMGHRMEVYCRPADARAVIDLAASFNIGARVIGRTEPSAHGEKNHLSISTHGEVLEYGLEQET